MNFLVFRTDYVGFPIVLHMIYALQISLLTGLRLLSHISTVSVCFSSLWHHFESYNTGVRLPTIAILQTKSAILNRIVEKFVF